MAITIHNEFFFVVQSATIVQELSKRVSLRLLNFLSNNLPF
jgi:hypothetical protein